MNTSARQLIDAMQNTLLPSLAHRLMYLIFFTDLFFEGSRSQGRIEAKATSFALLLIFACAAWMIGFLAIHERPSGRWGFKRRKDAPRNAFGAWSTPPAGGLKPPRMTRAIVMYLGREDGRGHAWGRALIGSVLMLIVAFLVLRDLDRPLVASFHPSLVSPELRSWLAWTTWGGTLALILRGWAVDGRKRLSEGGGATG